MDDETVKREVNEVNEEIRDWANSKNEGDDEKFSVNLKEKYTIFSRQEFEAIHFQWIKDNKTIEKFACSRNVDNFGKQLEESFNKILLKDKTGLKSKFTFVYNPKEVESKDKIKLKQNTVLRRKIRSSSKSSLLIGEKACRKQLESEPVEGESYTQFSSYSSTRSLAEVPKGSDGSSFFKKFLIIIVIVIAVLFYLKLESESYSVKLEDFLQNYHILGLQEGATIQEVKSAFRALSKLWHPDKNSSPEAPAKYIEINTAYKQITDYEKGILQIIPTTER